MPISLDLVFTALLVSFTCIQLFYYLFFFLRLAVHKTGHIDAMAQLHPVSIVISAFNEEANLKKNITKWLEQDYHYQGKPYFEVVVVNDNSEDDSFYFLNTMLEQYPHLHVVNLTQEAKLIPGKKFPLSMGIKSARFKRLLLTDADCVPASNQWLQHMASKLTVDKEIVLGYGPYVKHPTFLNKCIRFETALSAMQYLSYALARQPYMGVGRNLAYMKELFNKNKGFSSHHHIASGDDDLFINQVATATNTTIQIHPDSFVFSEPKKSWHDWHYQKKRHLSTGKFYKTKHKLLLGGFAFSHFLFWLSIIPAILFPKYIIISVSAIALRWLVQLGIYQSVLTKLQEKDLIPYIWFFDVWQLWYNVKSIPSIFFKSNNNHWR